MASRRQPPRVALKVIGSFVNCNVCGEPGGKMRTYYSPRSVSNETVVAGWGAYVSGEHPACIARVAGHGYTRHAGFPGWFPMVCGGCKHRFCEEGRVAVCLNPERKESGGAGLRAKRGPDGDVIGCSGRAA